MATWLEDVFGGGRDPYGIDRMTAGYDAFANSAYGQRYFEQQDRAYEESRRRYEAEFGLKKQQLDQSYAASRQQARTERERLDLDRWYREQQVALAREQYQAEMGLNYLKLQIEYQSSPDNYFRLQDLRAGAAGRQDVPIFLQNLLTNQTGPAFQQPGGSPQSGSLQQGMANLTGQSASTGSGSSGSSAPTDPRLAGILAMVKAAPPSGTEGYSPQDQMALRGIQALYEMGGGKVGAQGLESIGSVGRSLLGAGFKRIGGDPSIFQEQYDASRYRGGSGNPAAA